MSPRSPRTILKFILHSETSSLVSKTFANLHFNCSGEFTSPFPHGFQQDGVGVKPPLLPGRPLSQRGSGEFTSPFPHGFQQDSGGVKPPLLPGRPL
jgi:hypothetical protein